MTPFENENASHAPTPTDHLLCVAPMLDWTDRHCRYFLRQISPRARLFTEMVTTGAILFGDQERHLGFSKEEHPLVLQLGGSDPVALAEAALLGEVFGYDEINLNVGCPSSRVQSGAFGACLMATPELVAQCVQAMQDAVSIPVSVKCRIGIDDQDTDTDFARFVQVVAGAGCQIFYVHARKAWLKGLSPKQNRDVPPLNYPRVYDLKQTRPDLTLILNGGLKTLTECQSALPHVDGVMIGREAWHNPWFLRELETGLFPAPPTPPDLQREDVLQKIQPYLENLHARTGRTHPLTRHMMGLYLGQRGARQWRRLLSEESASRKYGTDILRQAARKVRLASAGKIRQA